jgi:hypothetical protein
MEKRGHMKKIIANFLIDELNHYKERNTDYKTKIEQLEKYNRRLSDEIRCRDESAERFESIIAARARIKSYTGDDNKKRYYIDLGDIDNYGSGKNDYEFVKEYLGMEVEKDDE